MNKTLHRSDIENLVPGLLYTQSPNFSLFGGMQACRAKRFETFEDAIEFLKNHVGLIVYFDQQNLGFSEIDRLYATGFILRFVDLTDLAILQDLTMRFVASSRMDDLNFNKTTRDELLAQLILQSEKMRK